MTASGHLKRCGRRGPDGMVGTLQVSGPYLSQSSGGKKKKPLLWFDGLVLKEEDAFLEEKSGAASLNSKKNRRASRLGGSGWREFPAGHDSWNASKWGKAP